MSRSDAVGAAWPAFMRYLATLPPPHGVIDALVDGPLAIYGATAGGIHRREGDALVLLGHCGYSQAAVARSQSISLTLDMPGTVAFRRNELVVRSVRDAMDEFAGMSLDPEIWGELAEQSLDGGFVVAPIGITGRCIGTYNFTVMGPATFTPQDLSYFLAIGSLLGLWLTHPETSSVTRGRSDGHPATPPLTLTERQIRILHLAATGRSNPAIAANLGYSISTVKQEMSRIMDTLRVDNRQEAIKRAQLLDLLSSDGEVAGIGR